MIRFSKRAKCGDDMMNAIYPFQLLRILDNSRPQTNNFLLVALEHYLRVLNLFLSFSAFRFHSRHGGIDLVAVVFERLQLIGKFLRFNSEQFHSWLFFAPLKSKIIL